MNLFAKIKGYLIFLQIGFFLSLYIVIIFINRKKVHPLRKWISSTLLKINGIDIKLEGSIDPQAQLFIINHQSMFDIMVMEHIYEGKLSWVAKKELFAMRFFGRVLIPSRDIALDRADKKGMIKLLKTAQNRINKGLSIAIFPEGTRSNKGGFLPFKPGAELVANQLHLKVQPIVIGPTKKLFDVHAMQLSSGIIQVTAFKSFNADDRPSPWLPSLREEMLKVYTQ